VHQGDSLNINCGTLRRIGKTTCIRELIRRNGQKNNIVLVPNSNFLQEYINIQVRPCIIPTDIENRRRYEFELSQMIRGSSENFYVYADEVPDAENIMRIFENIPTVHFVVGFYSTHNQHVYHRLDRLADRRLTSTSLQTPSFFEASWVSNVSDEMKTEVVLDKATKMKFIINEN
jgi:hypothetical protein